MGIFTFFKLYKSYQIAQHITYALLRLCCHFSGEFFSKLAKASISRSSFSEFCRVIFGKFFSASLIGLESNVLFRYPNGCQNFFIGTMKFIVSLTTPSVFKCEPIFPKHFLIMFLLFAIGILFISKIH